MPSSSILSSQFYSKFFKTVPFKAKNGEPKAINQQKGENKIKLKKKSNQIRYAWRKFANFQLTTSIIFLDRSIIKRFTKFTTQTHNVIPVSPKKEVNIYIQYKMIFFIKIGSKDRLEHAALVQVRHFCLQLWLRLCDQ